MANGAIHVEGLAALQRAWGAADKAIRDDMRDALAEAAAPVRSDAQRLAGSEIRNLHAGDAWASMRIGVHQNVAYVAPVERGVKGRGGQSKRRRNLADLLMGRAMQPALEHNRGRVEDRITHLIDEVANVWERQP